MRNMKIAPGEIVAIQGLGGLGHLAIQYARKMGYRTVAISSSDKKKDFASQLGATDYIDTSKEDAGEALAKMGGAGMIVVTAPSPKVITPLLKGVAPAGKLLLLARKLSLLSCQRTLD
jgi:D-arabinose 1-dehydrogenase-like Zn-dependent alcohol dehydrogenase